MFLVEEMGKCDKIICNYWEKFVMAGIFVLVSEREGNKCYCINYGWQGNYEFVFNLCLLWIVSNLYIVWVEVQGLLEYFDFGKILLFIGICILISIKISIVGGKKQEFFVENLQEFVNRNG